MGASKNCSRNDVKYMSRTQSDEYIGTLEGKCLINSQKEDLLVQIFLCSFPNCQYLNIFFFKTDSI